MENSFQLLVTHFNGLLPWLLVICMLLLVWTLLTSAASPGCCYIFVFRIKKCSTGEGTTDSDPVDGTWEAGRVYPWVKILLSQCSPWSTAGSCGKFAWVFHIFMPAQVQPPLGWCDQFAHIRDSRLDTKELPHKWCSSFLPNTNSEWLQLNRLLLCPYNPVFFSALVLSRGLLFNPCVS